MKKLSEKIALVAQICITFIFVLICLLLITNVINLNAEVNNGVTVVIMIVLAAVYAGISAFLLYMSFSERMITKEVLLYSDSESATFTSAGVVKKVAASCGKMIEGVKVRKVRIRLDDKMGLKLTVDVAVSGENAPLALDKLRILLADSYKNTIGLTFNSINFNIKKMKSTYVPDVEKAQKQAELLNSERNYTQEVYEEPIVENIDGNKGGAEELAQEEVVAEPVKEDATV